MIAIAALVGLAFASRYWSLDFATTMRRVIALAISCGFALYLGAVFRGAHLPRLLMHTALVMAVGSPAPTSLANVGPDKTATGKSARFKALAMLIKLPAPK